jgi:hypothetical protein
MELTINKPIKDITQLFQFKSLCWIVDNISINKTIKQYIDLIILSNYITSKYNNIYNNEIICSIESNIFTYAYFNNLDHVLVKSYTFQEFDDDLKKQLLTDLDLINDDYIYDNIRYKNQYKDEPINKCTGYMTLIAGGRQDNPRNWEIKKDTL